MILKMRNYAIPLLALTLAVSAIAVTTNLVSADPCIAQVNYPIMPAVYSNSNVPIVVPVSATCTTYYGSQLYATGNAYDATSNAGLGSVSTVLQSVNEGTIFNGQLGFNLPAATQGHTVQISVSVYNGQYGNLITATSETIQVGAGTQQISTTTTTQLAPYPYPSQYQYQAPQQSQRQPAYQSRSANGGTALFGYIAIAAILAAVIIATAGLVAYGRRQQYWPPMQSPPGR